MNIYKKMYLGYGLSFVLLIVLASFMLLKTFELSNISFKIYEYPYNVSKITNNLKSDIISLQLQTQRLLDTSNSEIKQEIIKTMIISEKSSFINFDLLKDKYLGNKDEIKDTYDIFIELKGLRANIIHYVLNNNYKEAKNKKIKTYSTIKNINKKINNLTIFSIKQADLLYEKSVSTQRTVTIFILVSIITVITFLLAIAYVNIKSMGYSQNKINEYFDILTNNVMVVKTNLDGIITEVTNEFMSTTGYKKYELIGKNINLLKYEGNDEEIYNDLWNTIISNDTWIGEIKNLKKDGNYFFAKLTINSLYDDNKNKIGYISVLEDITCKKKLEEISRTDPLTSLYNKKYFDEIFESQFKIAKRNKARMAFAIIDIDNFKKYNDTYGHEKVEITIIEISKILKKSLNRPNDYVFRLDSDEFCMLYNVEDEQIALDILGRTKDAIEALNIEFENNMTNKNVITVSIGLYINSSYLNNDSSDIYKKAELALYEAKDSGKNTIYSIFE